MKDYTAEILDFIPRAQHKIADLASEIVELDGDTTDLPLLLELSDFLEVLFDEENVTSERDLLVSVHYLSHKANLNSVGDPSILSFQSGIFVRTQPSGGSTGGSWDGRIGLNFKVTEDQGFYKPTYQITEDMQMNSIIQNMLVEKKPPLVDINISSVLRPFNETKFSLQHNFSVSIINDGAVLNKMLYQWSRDNVNWNTIFEVDFLQASYLQTGINPTPDNRPIYYELQVLDSMNEVGVARKTVTFEDYIAPNVVLSVGSALREKGDIVSNVSATIQRRSTYVDLISAGIQYRINGSGDWYILGAGTLSAAGGTLMRLHSDAALKEFDKLEYRVAVTDKHTVTYSNPVAINFVYKYVVGYSKTLNVTMQQILAMGNTILTNGKERVVSGVTATEEEYTIIAYRAGAGDLSSILLDSAPILGAFTKIADVAGFNNYGASLVYRIYRSNSTKAFTNETLNIK